jgi:hypothetical protein
MTPTPQMEERPAGSVARPPRCTGTPAWVPSVEMPASAFAWLEHPTVAAPYLCRGSGVKVR